MSAYKVDTVIGHEMWRLLEGTYDKLLKAVRDCAVVKLSDAAMLESGDILWDESRASVGASYSPFDIGATVLGVGKPLPRAQISAFDRHPAQLAELVHLTSYKVMKIDSATSKAFRWRAGGGEGAGDCWMQAAALWGAALRCFRYDNRSHREVTGVDRTAAF